MRILHVLNIFILNKVQKICIIFLPFHNQTLVCVSLSHKSTCNAVNFDVKCKNVKRLCKVL